MENKSRLLVVEDETPIRTGLIDVFVFHGFDVDFAVDGLTGLEKSLTGNYDLILLDVMLPGMNGFDVCERIRAADRQQPVIMLTAKSADEDVILGLSLGADDYVAKPFSVAQLVLRVQAVLRRVSPRGEALAFLELDQNVNVDVRNLSADVRGEQVAFTRREMEMLEYLYAHSSAPVSREELLNKVWGYPKDTDIETRTVDMHIAKLRRKIEADPATPTYLRTVRGAGYRLFIDAARGA